MTIFSAALKRIFKSKVRFIVIMLCPFIFISAFALQNHRAATIGLVDKDNTIVSEGIYHLLKETEGVEVIRAEEDEIYDLTASYVVDYSIIIDSGLENALLKGQPVKLREYYIEDREKLYFIRNSITNELDNYRLLAKASNYNKQAFIPALEKYREPGPAIESNLEETNRNIKARTAIGFLVQFMLYMAIITTGLIIEDKANGTYYRIFYGPVSMKRYMAENLSAFFITALIQSMGIILTLKVIFDIYLGSKPFAIIGLFVIYSLVCITLGILVISVCKKPIQAYLTVAVITSPLTMLGGCYWSLDKMPDIMKNIAQFIPLSWVMKTFDAGLEGTMTTNSLMLNYGILLLFACIFFIAGVAKKVDISK